MAFTVEDGTGKADANAYVDVAYVDSYFSDRANASWTGTTAAKQAAIIKATDYIEVRWGQRFLGRKEFPETPQALNFPRLGLLTREGYYVVGIPDKLKSATAEYALRALSAELMPDPTIADSGQKITMKREKVGPIEEETHYDGGAGEMVLLRPYPAADRLLAEYVFPAGRAYR